MLFISGLALVVLFLVLDFFLESVAGHSDMMQADGLHPNKKAQNRANAKVEADLLQAGQNDVLDDTAIAKAQLVQAETMLKEAEGLKAEATRLKKEAIKLDPTLKPKRTRATKTTKTTKAASNESKQAV